VWFALTWARAVGGTVFLFGGVLPLVWFILSRARRLVREVEIEENEWDVYEKDWAAHEEEIVRLTK
jgi:nitric oxide reductase subunit B